MPTPLPLVDGALLVDGTTLTSFSECCRKGYYAYVAKREPCVTSPALTFGGAIHEALALRYTGTLPVGSPELHTAQQKVMENYIAKNGGLPVEDHRNLNLATSIMEEYDKFYPNEPFNVLKGASGAPAVEFAFALPLGEIPVPSLILGQPSKMIKVLWMGKIDLITEWSDGIYGLDHKTTSVYGSTFYDNYVNNQAQLGYCWAVQQVLGQKVGGFVVNTIVIRKPTKTGKGLEFGRMKFSVEQSRLKEWVFNTLALIQHNIIDCAEKGYFPMETSQCVTKYNRCPYFDVCCVPPNNRDSILHSPMFKDVTWSPLKKEGV